MLFMAKISSDIKGKYIFTTIDEGGVCNREVIDGLSLREILLEDEFDLLGWEIFDIYEYHILNKDDEIPEEIREAMDESNYKRFYELVPEFINKQIEIAEYYFGFNGEGYMPVYGNYIDGDSNSMMDLIILDSKGEIIYESAYSSKY